MNEELLLKILNGEAVDSELQVSELTGIIKSLAKELEQEKGFSKKYRDANAVLIEKQKDSEKEINELKMKYMSEEERRKTEIEKNKKEYEETINALKLEKATINVFKLAQKYEIEPSDENINIIFDLDPEKAEKKAANIKKMLDLAKEKLSNEFLKNGHAPLESHLPVAEKEVKIEDKFKGVTASQAAELYRKEFMKEKK